MKTIRSNKGPFIERPHFEIREIEEICTTELRKAGFYPTTPQAIRIERFIEKRFGVSPTYEWLPDGVLGFTRFGANGVEEIVISADLEKDDRKSNERRLLATLAHEAGHGLLHAHLFYLGTKPLSLFGETDDSPKILCRDVAGEGFLARGYTGRWWEYQANKTIGALLMPRRLIEEVLRDFTTPVGSFGKLMLAPGKKESVIHTLSETFDVNPVAARIRLADVLPSENEAQAAL